MRMIYSPLIDQWYIPTYPDITSTSIIQPQWRHEVKTENLFLSLVDQFRRRVCWHPSAGRREDPRLIVRLFYLLYSLGIFFYTYHSVALHSNTIMHTFLGHRIETNLFCWENSSPGREISAFIFGGVSSGVFGGDQSGRRWQVGTANQRLADKQNRPIVTQLIRAGILIFKSYSDILCKIN